MSLQSGGVKQVFLDETQAKSSKLLVGHAVPSLVEVSVDLLPVGHVQKPLQESSATFRIASDDRTTHAKHMAFPAFTERLCTTIIVDRIRRVGLHIGTGLQS